MSEFAMKLRRFFIVCFRCLGKVNEISDMSFFAVEVNSGTPFVIAPKPRDALKSRTVIPLFFPILCILRMSRGTNILPSVIKSISVAMVYFCFRMTIKNLPVHPDYLLPFPANGVSILAVPDTSGTPIPSIKPIKIFGIDNCNFPLCERDVSERLVKRLENFRSSDFIQSAFGAHRFTSNESLLPAAILA